MYMYRHGFCFRLVLFLGQVMAKKSKIKSKTQVNKQTRQRHEIYIFMYMLFRFAKDEIQHLAYLYRTVHRSTCNMHCTYEQSFCCYYIVDVFGHLLMHD